MSESTVELSLFRTADGRVPFADWWSALGDHRSRLKIAQRLDRLQAGNPGDCQTLGSGLMELRIHAGPGLRIYISWLSPERCLIITGGSKATQTRDIARARLWLSDAKQRQGE